MSRDEVPPEDLETTRAAEPEGSTARRIDHYRILQKVGEGGMGEVYEAEQEEPVRRRVALKVIKHGMDTKQVVARFEAERQALAMMDHPSVAKVFEAGATPRGRPYFVMEFVRGVPVTEHCDRQKLSIRERLELFLQVCEGVQHAHRNAIIHRDLKPSNVLVSIQEGQAVPKIIDFGVAKATTQKLTEKTMFTELGVLIGTPEYMSPEQAEGTGQSVDTRTDVYSLGVMHRQLRGDLDWITMRAMEKDRTRRYGSPSDLAEDIRRHLKNEPVVASPPSAVYRVKKFVRRNRVAVGVSALVLGVLVTFAVTTAVQSRWIAREAETSERVSEFLADMLGSVDPHVLGSALWQDLNERVENVRRANGATEEEIGAALASLGESLSGVNATDAALQLLDEQILARAAETIEEQLEDEPRIAARLEHTLGDTYRKLGMYRQADRHAQRAVETRRGVLGPEHSNTLTSLEGLARTYTVRGRFDEAEPIYRETLEIRRRMQGPEHQNTLQTMTALGRSYRDQGRFGEAQVLFREVVDVRRRVLGEDHPDTTVSMRDLAGAYFAGFHLQEAEELHRQVMEIRRRVKGRDHPETLSAMNSLANTVHNLGKHGEAEALYRENLAIYLRVLGRDHPETLLCMTNLATVIGNQGRYDEAEPIFRETVDRYLRVLGPDHPRTLLCMVSLGRMYESQGRYETAEELHHETLETRRRVLGQDHPDTLASMGFLASVYHRQERYADAEELYREGLEIYRRVLGQDDPRTLSTLGRLMALYRETESVEKTRPLVAELLSVRKAAAEAPEADANAKNTYAWAMLTSEPTDLQDPEAALPFAVEANELTDFKNPNYLDTLALAYHRTGRSAEAVDMQKKAIALLPDGSKNQAVFEEHLAEFEAVLERAGERHR